MRRIKQLIVLGMTMSMVSCSVEKRLHMPGHHVKYLGQRHSSVKNEMQELADVKSTDPALEFETEADEKIISSKNILVQDSMEAEVETSNSSRQPFIEKQRQNVVSIVRNFAPGTENGFNSKIRTSKIFTASAERQKTDKPFQNSAANVTGGLLIMLVALLLAGIGYIFFLYLGIFGTILFFIFGLGAAIFFIAGIFIMIFGK